MAELVVDAVPLVKKLSLVVVGMLSVEAVPPDPIRLGCAPSLPQTTAP